MRDFLIKADWFKGMETANDEVLKEIFYRTMKLGMMEQEIDTSQDVYPISAIWSGIEGNIVRMKNAQESYQEYGKTHGRKAKGQDDDIKAYKLAHPAARVKEVGEALGYEPGNSGKGPFAWIYDNKGWKEAVKEIKAEKNSDKIPKSEKNSENSSEKIPKTESEKSEKLFDF